MTEWDPFQLFYWEREKSQLLCMRVLACLCVCLSSTLLITGFKKSWEVGLHTSSSHTSVNTLSKHWIQVILLTGEWSFTVELLNRNLAELNKLHKLFKTTNRLQTLTKCVCVCWYLSVFLCSLSVCGCICTKQWCLFIIVYLLSLSRWPCWAWWPPWSSAPRSWAKSGHRCSWGGPVENKHTRKHTLISWMAVGQWKVICNGNLDRR